MSRAFASAICPRSTSGISDASSLIARIARYAIDRDLRMRDEASARSVLASWRGRPRDRARRHQDATGKGRQGERKGPFEARAQRNNIGLRGEVFEAAVAGRAGALEGAANAG